MTAPIPGIPFPGRADWIIPPLSLGALELLQDRISALQVGGADPESVRTIIDATHAALQRNYPDISRADVADALDLGNMVDVIQSVMDIAGVRRSELEKKAAAAPSP